MSQDLFGNVIAEPERMEHTAELSPCGLYRYALGRRWGLGKLVAWIGLNPSTADAEVDDPTIRRMVNYSRAWGYGALTVRNLFAFRSKQPADLLNVDDPVGQRNDQALAEAFDADLVVAAWGGSMPYSRDEVVLRMRPEVTLYCLGTTRTGAPRHPLYCRSGLQPQVLREGKR